MVCNMAAKRVALFTTLESNLSCSKSAGCFKLCELLTFDWINLRGSHIIHGSSLLQKKFALGLQNAQQAQILLQKVELTTLYSYKLHLFVENRIVTVSQQGMMH